MKKIFILLTIFSFIASSCSDVLEVEPLQSVDSENALKTQTDVESAVIGLYSILGRGSLYGTNISFLSELLGAEQSIRWRGTFQSYRQVGGKTMDSENAEATRTWVNAFAGINLANNVLAALDKVEDDDLRLTLEGEAKLVRGLLHFELVRLYGRAWNDGNPAVNLGVPIWLTPTINEQTASELPSRATVAQVYQQVIADMEDAEGLLPEDNGDRLDTYAASAFLARVYLQQSNYTEALDKANRVISSDKYSLNSSVTAIFLNDNTNESIFEIQQNDQNNAGNGNDGLATFYASLDGIGRGDVQVLAFFSDDPDDYIFNDRVTIYDQYETQDKRFTELFYFGTDFSRRPGRLTTFKWNNPGQNIPVVRLAEMYLIRAEANLQLGTSVGDSPLNDVNLIRERAEASLLGAVTLNDVIQERKLELAFEGVRIHDVKRLEQEIDGYFFDGDLNTYVLDYSIAWDDQFMILPIPQREIDANENLRNQQNSGY
ncbi:MAG: RagB/SusD family nutrient uptake outer membrane protein [Cyclobacteriaceae bacterium]|nr:RagB/SusD family nutrient uptake outer membrane protein [Cyclobacteriaceae bacterium]